MYTFVFEMQGLFLETTLRAAGTEQQQEEGGKTAMKQSFLHRQTLAS